MKNAVSYISFAKAFQWKTEFGPLWSNPVYVMACLKRYLASEGHKANGWTVDKLAKCFLADPLEASGEEIDAITCLLKLGCAEMVID